MPPGPVIMAPYLSTGETQRQQHDLTLPHVEAPLYRGSIDLFLGKTDAATVERAQAVYRVWCSCPPGDIYPGGLKAWLPLKLCVRKCFRGYREKE